MRSSGRKYIVDVAINLRLGTIVIADIFTLPFIVNDENHFRSKSNRFYLASLECFANFSKEVADLQYKRYDSSILIIHIYLVKCFKL